MTHSKQETIIYAKKLLEEHRDDLLFLDTETTGLSSTDQVIELGIVDINGKVIFDQRFKPSVEINPHAENVHGISMSDLEDMPIWKWRKQELVDKLHHKKWIIFNKEFDLRLMHQSHLESSFLIWEEVAWSIHCAMQMAANVFGSSSAHHAGRISLANACLAAEIDTSQYKAHSAVGDCLMTKDLFLKIASMETE